ncbi:MAG: hypothetical protein ACREEV_13235 [Dongiaceae bacterium]
MSAMRDERRAPMLTPLGYGARVGLALLLLAAGVAMAIESWPCHWKPNATCVR